MSFGALVITFLLGVITSIVAAMLLPHIKKTHPKLMAKIIVVRWYVRTMTTVFLNAIKEEMAKPSRGDTKPCAIDDCPGTCEYRAIKITEVAEGQQELRQYTVCKWMCDTDPSHIESEAG